MLLAHMALSSEFSDLSPCFIHYHKLFAIWLCAYLGSDRSTTILTIVQKKFLSTTFRNIKPPRRIRPHHSLHLIGLSRDLIPFWRALLIAHCRHSSPQLHPNRHRRLRGTLSLSMGFRRVTHLRTLCSGGR